MQFVADGPDVPEELLQAHEEGKVVFFCGAGISYPAGLPGFKGLVERIYELSGTTKSEIELEAFKSEKYDATLDLLERRLPGQRGKVRSALAAALKPNLKLKGATATHEALLRLAETRSGALRLVTTNFDRLFDAAAKRSKQKLQTFNAPMLPIPKKSRWNGLVALHGVLPNEPDEDALNRLVVTSGDFGLAYLTERWAARFVSELFRNYIVCFIGYSINDPVLRYMMDALAADRMLGETTPQAWAFGDCEPGQEDRKTTEWKAKGVTPILYKVTPDNYDHWRLHKTLRSWSETYRDGITGKMRMVSVNAFARPSSSTKEDDFVGRMLWALADKTGGPARQFAELNPVPPLEWLTHAFSDTRFRHCDLNRFGIPVSLEVDEELRFSLIDRPTPHGLAPRMRLASGVTNNVAMDEVMRHLSQWLIRHLNDPQLLMWVVSQGGVLHSYLGALIEKRLNDLAFSQRGGGSLAIKEISTHAPNAIVTPQMELLWRILLSGRVKSLSQHTGLHSWLSRVRTDGMSVLHRLELRTLLAPKLLLREPMHWGSSASDNDGEKRLKDSLNWEVVLASNHVRSTLQDLMNCNLSGFLPGLIDDFERLLLEALDLASLLGDATNRSDKSYRHLPSIMPHPQNRGFREWVTLIELLRDMWLALRLENSSHASQIAVRWFDMPYPAFKRLAFFAASQEECVDQNIWVSWLTSNEGWWLWSIETRREVLRLLVLQGGQLSRTAGAQLQRAILKGPPRDIYRIDLELERIQGATAHSIWLNLAKLQTSGFKLNASAAKRLQHLSVANPLWRVSENERDEFSSWMTGTGDPDFESRIEVSVAPDNKAELIEWLKLPAKDSYGISRDTWSDTCRTRPLTTLHALSELSSQGEWPIERWREALRAWWDRRLHARFWTHAVPVVLALPGNKLGEIAHSVSSWLEVLSEKTTIRDEDQLYALCRRLMDLPSESDAEPEDDSSNARPVNEAINHPVGMVTQVLINHWYRQSPRDNEELPPALSDFFTELTDTNIQRYRHGRVILGSHLISLYRVDKDWTEHCLLPLLNWERDAFEAKGIWEGFLWSPRLYQPLLAAFKSELLQTAHHYEELGEHKQQFAAFFTYVAIGPVEGFSVQELRTAIAALPVDGLEESAQALSQALEGAAGQREENWSNRIQPFWERIWPKSLELKTERIADSLAQLALAAGKKFPVALKAIFDWLMPLEFSYSVMQSLADSGHCSLYPKDSLALLDAVTGEHHVFPAELRKCLSSIVQSEPALRDTAQFRRLDELLQRMGG